MFPHKRWSRLLTTWRPRSETYCSCQFFTPESDLAKAHLKARVFASRFHLPKKQACSIYAQCMEPSHREWRCFQRTLTSALLTDQRSTSKDTMLVGEVMAHQGSPPENATTAHSTDESEGLAGAPSAFPKGYLTRNDTLIALSLIHISEPTRPY